MSLLGLDIGSSGIKGVAFDENGNILAEAHTTYHTIWNGNRVEADANEIWFSCAAAIREISAKVSDIEALCVSSHGETVVPVGADKEPVGNAIMNSDNRAEKETARWERDNGKKRIYAITGLPLHTMFALNKIMWLKSNTTETYNKTMLFLSAADYILLKLGAEPLTDYSLAGRTMAFDIKRRDWSEELLREADIPKKLLPVCVPSGTVAGKLSQGIALNLGLPTGTVIAVGGHDQPMAAFGCGAISPGQVSDSAGTYECLAAVSDKPKNNDTAFGYSLNSYCHVVRDKYITLAFFPAGFAINTFVREFCYEDKIKAEAAGKSVYEYLADKISSLPTEVCITPHLVGSCNPFWDMRARGMVYGLTPDITRHQLFKAVFEGISMELALNMGVLEKAVGAFDSVFINGGNARMPFSVQLRADITGKRFYTMDTGEAVCKGAATFAGIACGVYRDEWDAVQKCVRVEKEYQPDKTVFERYAHQKSVYAALYPSLHTVRSL